jgi:hypothetical protein
VRDAGEDAVVGLFNLTNDARSVALTDGPFAGNYVDFDSGDDVPLAAGSTLEVGPWGYRLLVRGAGARS